MKNTRPGNHLSRDTPRLKKENYFLLLVLLIGLVAAWPLLSNPGLLNTRGGGDSPFLLQRLQQLVTALGDGHFPVRWMPDANYGYGYPFYNFYAPLSIYIAALFHFFGFSFVAAIKLAQLSGFLVAAWAMFVLGRRWLGGLWSGLLAAAAYTLAPFHLVNIYVRGDSLAEFWAMAIYPLIFLAADQLLRTGRNNVDEDDHRTKTIPKLRLAALALAYGALVLSHNISALIISPFLLLFLISGVLDNRPESQAEATPLRERLGKLSWPLLALTVGLALSAWFWLPALAERSLAQLEPVTSGYFHYSNHFRGTGLVQPQLLFDYDVAGGGSFRMGLVQAILVILGLIALLLPGQLLRRTGHDSQAGPRLMVPMRIFLIGGLAIATFMITPWSRSLWDQLPLLSFTQFPWRFLSVQAFFAALIIAALARLPGRQLIVLGAIGLLLISSLGRLEPDFLLLTDDDVSPERLAQYEWFSGNIGSTVSAEYLPYTVQPRPYTSPWLNSGKRDTVQEVEGTLVSANLLERESTGQSWRFDSENPGAKVTIATLDWPEWQAEAPGTAGTEGPLLPAAGSGLILVDLPPGEQSLAIKLTDPPVRIAGELVALAALGVVIWLGLSSRSIRLRKSHGLIVIALIFLFLALKVWPEKQLSADNLTWDFDQMAFLHHDQDGVPYDNGGRLRSYSYSAEQLSAGDRLTITLIWEGAGAEEVTVSLATPAVNRFKDAPLLAGQSSPVVEGVNLFHLDLSENSPSGLYIPRVIVEGADPLMVSGQKRGDLFLRPVRVKNNPPESKDEKQPLDARAIQVKQRDPATLDIQMQWFTQSPLTRNYNFSLRLMDSTGRPVAHLDNQPGYGFQPSSGWPAGVWVNDWLAVPLAPDFLKEVQQPLSLVVRLYDVTSGDVALVRPLGELTWTGDELSYQAAVPVYQLPENLSPISTEFGEKIGLRGYQIDQMPDSLDLTLYWQALSEDMANYSHFVHLVDSTTGDIQGQHDGMPKYDSYPTRLWSIEEIVADPLTLDLSEVPEGRYHLLIGLYQLVDDVAVRLPVSSGNSLDVDSTRLPEVITISR